MTFDEWWNEEKEGYFLERKVAKIAAKRAWDAAKCSEKPNSWKDAKKEKSELNTAYLVFCTYSEETENELDIAFFDKCWTSTTTGEAISVYWFHELPEPPRYRDEY